MSWAASSRKAVGTHEATLFPYGLEQLKFFKPQVPQPLSGKNNTYLRVVIGTERSSFEVLSLVNGTMIVLNECMCLCLPPPNLISSSGKRAGWVIPKTFPALSLESAEVLGNM